MAVSLRRIVKDFQPDVIYSYGWLTYSLLPSLRAGHPPLLLSVR